MQPRVADKPRLALFDYEDGGGIQAGDELTGLDTVATISKASGRDIGYAGFDPEMMRADNADFAEMFSWFNKVGYSADIEGLRRDFPEVKWQRLGDWAQQQDWSVLQQSTNKV